MRNLTAQDRNVAFLIFGASLACYLLTYTGLIDSSDGLSMFATTESMVRRGELDSNQLLWMGLQQGSFGPDGDLYSRKGIGMALLAYPLVWLAKPWSTLGLVQAALLLNPLLTAYSGALVYPLAAVWIGGYRRPLPPRWSLAWLPWPGPIPRAILATQSVPGVFLPHCMVCWPMHKLAVSVIY